MTDKQDSYKVFLVGHCIPDSYALKSALRSISSSIKMERINNEQTLIDQLSEADLLLVNRVLEGRFSSENGVDLIASLASNNAVNPPKMMLVSNYEDAQQHAVQAGAVPGIGKSSLYDDQTAQRIQSAFGIAEHSANA